MVSTNLYNWGRFWTKLFHLTRIKTEFPLHLDISLCAKQIISDHERSILDQKRINERNNLILNKIDHCLEQMNIWTGQYDLDFNGTFRVQTTA